MKKYSTIVSLSIFCFMIYWSFIKPKFQSKHISLAGEVIFILKQKRGARHIIEVKENNKVKYVQYAFIKSNSDIKIGDSLFKQSGSDELIVKNKADGIKRLANDQQAVVSE